MIPTQHHRHLIVRAEVSNPPGPDDIKKVESWMSALIKTVGMKELFAPKAVWCPVEGNVGLTCFSIIETSHCGVHFWSEVSPAVGQIDLYSCSDFDIRDVFDAMRAFDPIAMDFKFLDRDNGLKMIDEGFHRCRSEDRS